jgi:molybdate transport system substrate-binding protein
MRRGETALKPIDCLSSMATRRILADLAALCEAGTGQPVTVRSMGGVDAAAKVRDGNVLDVVVLASPAMARLAQDGLLVAGSRFDLARSDAAFAVRAGLPVPDLSQAQGVRSALVAARAIAYSTGPSGDHLMAVLEAWGLLPSLGPRLVKAPPGVPVGSLVARGDADLGFQQYSELVDLPGIAIVGDLAPEIQAATIFTGAVAASSTQPDAAHAVVRFLASAEAAPVYSSHGMTALAG